MSTKPIPTGGPRSPRLDKYQLLEEEYHRVRDELTQARATIENYDRELRSRSEKLRQATQYIDYLERENQRSKDSINGLQDDSNEVQGKGLLGSQADALSISEVSEKVDALNEEIFQAAATLADALIHKRHGVSQTELDAATSMSQEMVGEKITNILITQSQKPEPEVNLLLVQVVLQIVMIKFCVSKIQSWYPGDSVIGGFLSAMYSEILSDGKYLIDINNQVLPDAQYFLEEQAVSGRWRALTRAHTRPTTETWEEELYQELDPFLIIASWTPRSPKHEESFGSRLPSIFKAINELRMAIGEKFTSADLDVFVFECDRSYDPAIMDDAYGDGRQSSGKRAPEAIAGTTGIGLGKVIAGTKDVLQIRSLIPVKIVLWSTLNKALGPRQKKPVENTDGANQDGRD